MAIDKDDEVALMVKNKSRINELRTSDGFNNFFVFEVQKKLDKLSDKILDCDLDTAHEIIHSLRSKYQELKSVLSILDLAEESIDTNIENNEGRLKQG